MNLLLNDMTLGYFTGEDVLRIWATSKAARREMVRLGFRRRFAYAWNIMRGIRYYRSRIHSKFRGAVWLSVAGRRTEQLDVCSLACRGGGQFESLNDALQFLESLAPWTEKFDISYLPAGIVAAQLYEVNALAEVIKEWAARIKDRRILKLTLYGAVKHLERYECQYRSYSHETDDNGRACQT